MLSEVEYVKINFAYEHRRAGLSELADEADSKSVGGNIVRVRPPQPADKRTRFERIGSFLICAKATSQVHACMDLATARERAKLAERVLSRFQQPG